MIVKVYVCNSQGSLVITVSFCGVIAKPYSIYELSLVLHEVLNPEAEA